MMTTLSGHVINLLDPDPKTLAVEDIALGLSNLCRYAGQVTQFYSVAQHSVLVAQLVAEHHPGDYELILAGLLHDGTEAYLVDMPSPLKKVLPPYIEIENNFAEALALRFGFPSAYFDKVKVFDIAIRPDEMTQLTRYGEEFLEGPVLGIKIEALSPEQSRKLFMDVYQDLVLRLPRLKNLDNDGPTKAAPARKPRELSIA